MTEPLKYHPGEIAVQQRADAFDPADLDGNGLATSFDSRVSAFLSLQRWAVISGLDQEANIWVSCLWGPPGFLKAENAGSLAIHAYLPKGDPLSATFTEAGQIGIVVLDPATRRRTRINGTARSDGKAIHISTREVYANCPKYIQRREVSSESHPIAASVESYSELTAPQQRWIERADTFFIGTMHAEAGLDCSHRGGNPGFVRATGPNTITFPDYAGNNMFQTLGNLELDSRTGLLFIDFETGSTLQLTGRANVHCDKERLTSWPGAQRLIEFHVERIQETAHALPLRWRLLDYSPFNP
jgi:predicted pyridoxine 5'-phosphate oxidase superfamily flavin-nucleotide-binding protein